jgi:hypothetical protein
MQHFPVKEMKIKTRMKKLVANIVNILVFVVEMIVTFLLACTTQTAPWSRNLQSGREEIIHILELGRRKWNREENKAETGEKK